MLRDGITGSPIISMEADKVRQQSASGRGIVSGYHLLRVPGFGFGRGSKPLQCWRQVSAELQLLSYSGRCCEEADLPAAFNLESLYSTAGGWLSCEPFAVDACKAAAHPGADSGALASHGRTATFVVQRGEIPVIHGRASVPVTWSRYVLMAGGCAAFLAELVAASAVSTRTAARRRAATPK